MSHASNDIGQEEVPKPDLAKWSNSNLQDRIQQFIPSNRLEALDAGLAAQNEKNQA